MAERGSRTKGQRGGVQPKAEKKKWLHQFWWRRWLLTCPKELRMVLLVPGVWVTVVTVLAVGESRRAFELVGIPQTYDYSSSEDGKEKIIQHNTLVLSKLIDCRSKSQFMADSKLHCLDCNTDVLVVTGRISNLSNSKTYWENKVTKVQPLQKKEKLTLSWNSVLWIV